MSPFTAVVRRKRHHWSCVCNCWVWNRCETWADDCRFTAGRAAIRSSRKQGLLTPKLHVTGLLKLTPYTIHTIYFWVFLAVISVPFLFLSQTLIKIITGWPRHRENRENREFGSYFFQTGKTQGILFWHREKFANTGKIFGLWLLI